jgi:hypothetical protein
MSRVKRRREPLERLRHHKLMTREIREALPPLYATEDAPMSEKLLVAKFFCPYNGWRWYATEFDGNDIFFGYVEGAVREWGYFPLSGLLTATVGGDIPAVERDLHFQPVRFSDLAE